MATQAIKFLARGSGKAFWLLAALSFLVVMSFFTPPSSQATPAPPPGTGGWQVQADVACAAPASGQPTCEFSGTVIETGNSESALQSSHEAVLADAASDLHVTFTSVAVDMDDGTYSGTASIYDSQKRLVVVRKVTFYVTDNTAYLSNPNAFASWLQTNSAPGDTYKADATISFHVTQSNATQGKVSVTAYVGSDAVAGTTSQFPISQAQN